MFQTDFRYEPYEDGAGNRKPNPEPMQVYGPVYSIGPLTVCVYLVKTTDGLILFDAGYDRDSDWMLDNILKLGMDPKDIKSIFLTHWHWDHAGGAAGFAKVSGADVLIHEQDAEIVRAGRRRIAGAEAHTIPGVPNAKTIGDREEIALGDVTVKALFTPGQSAGSMVYLFTVNGPQGPCRALAAGDSTGFKSGVKALERLGYPGVCRDYEKTVPILKSIEFDLYLGGHPHQVFNEMRSDGLPFVTREQWHAMVDNRHKQMTDFLAAHPECNR